MCNPNNKVGEANKAQGSNKAHPQKRYIHKVYIIHTYVDCFFKIDASHLKPDWVWNTKLDSRNQIIKTVSMYFT